MQSHRERWGRFSFCTGLTDESLAAFATETVVATLAGSVERFADSEADRSGRLLDRTSDTTGRTGLEPTGTIGHVAGMRR